jgi:hypothetical protein
MGEGVPRGAGVVMGRGPDRVPDAARAGGAFGQRRAGAGVGGPRW